MLSATGIASAIHMREVRAREVVAMAIERISTGNNALNCFTTVLADRAMADADAVDKAIAGGYDPGPLAGVPFAVKNLYDVAADSRHSPVPKSQGKTRPPSEMPSLSDC